jgi:hypothetical protein
MSVRLGAAIRGFQNECHLADARRKLRPDWVMKGSHEHRYRATALDRTGKSAVIAYSVRRVVPGPNGEGHQAFVVCSRDSGATWACVPLVRTIWSHVRFWGFPVWPPEHIDSVAIDRGALRIGFRDEWVPFEPGGESLWRGSCSSGGLWSVERIRLMDYEGADSSASPQPIAVGLPPGFGPPPLPFLEHIASRLATDAPTSSGDKYAWLVSFPVGIAAALLGGGWGLSAVVVVVLVGLPVGSLLLERRRRRKLIEQL